MIRPLAREAEEAGAELWLSARALAKDGDGILVRRGDGHARIKAKVIVGADGPHSRVGRWIGSVNRNLIPALQARVPLVSPMEFAEIYFDKDIYGGYGWLFPKGKEADVGVGKKQGKGRMKPIRETLACLISRLVEEGKIRGEISRRVAGWIPAERPRAVSRENILLAGDAAGQTHPISGAGVSQAVICGQMAGRWAARAAESGDLGVLLGYEEEWQELFGDTQERAFNRRRLLEREWDRLEEIIKTCWIAFRGYYAGS